MKATGIVRRIDDLGRVVIPKEIRRTMRIREGDPLEIYTDMGGEVIFKKYSPIRELSDFVNDYAEALTSGTKLSVLICDRDKCVSSARISKKDTIDKELSSELESIIGSRKSFISKDEQYSALKGLSNRICAVSPITSSGDLTGAVVLVQNENCKSACESDVQLINVAAKFLGNQTM